MHRKVLSMKLYRPYTSWFYCVMLHNIMFNMAHHTHSCYMREACVRAYLLRPVTVYVILPLRWTPTPTPEKQVMKHPTLWCFLIDLDMGTLRSFIGLISLKIKYIRLAFYDPGLIAWNNFRSCWQWTVWSVAGGCGTGTDSAWVVSVVTWLLHS